MTVGYMVPGRSTQRHVDPCERMSLSRPINVRLVLGLLHLPRGQPSQCNTDTGWCGHAQA